MGLVVHLCQLRIWLPSIMLLGLTPLLLASMSANGWRTAQLRLPSNAWYNRQHMQLSFSHSFFFGMYKTKRYIDTLGVHSWEPPGTSRYAQHQRFFFLFFFFFSFFSFFFFFLLNTRDEQHTLSQPTRRRANTANGKEGLKHASTLR